MIKQEIIYVDTFQRMKEVNQKLEEGWLVLRVDKFEGNKYISSGLMYLLEYKDIKEYRKEKLKEIESR